MKNIVKKAGVTLGAFLLPAVAFAQQASYNINNAQSLFAAIKGILNAVVPIIIALAVVYVLWGVVQSFFLSKEEDRKAGHFKILYGIIALFVMVSIWGLVNILVQTAGLSNTTNIPGTVPNLNNIQNGS